MRGRNYFHPILLCPSRVHHSLLIGLPLFTLFSSSSLSLLLRPQTSALEIFFSHASDFYCRRDFTSPVRLLREDLLSRATERVMETRHTKRTQPPMSLNRWQNRTPALKQIQKLGRSRKESAVRVARRNPRPTRTTTFIFRDFVYPCP